MGMQDSPYGRLPRNFALTFMSVDETFISFVKIGDQKPNEIERTLVPPPENGSNT
jgi:hypothetical protein